MRKFILNLLPENEKNRLWVAVLFSLIFSILLTLWGIYVMRDYGIAIFILTPCFMGLSSTVVYALKNRHISLKKAQSLGFITLSLYAIGLLIFAIEGLICIAMATPIALALSMLGSYLGYLLINKNPDKAPLFTLLLLLSIPITGYVEKDSEPKLNQVITQIEIQADLQTVWANVIEFPELEEPNAFIFKTGIAYPIDAKIEGAGIGAIRHCNFTTGSFVEPITVWNEPNLLCFDVLEQPEPMKELSFWDIDAPHLHDYFVSKKGQFKLTKLPNGNTLLEGTTWYYHNIRPAAYWQLWSDYIIHKIHERVLEHIKKNAERNTP